MGGNERVDPVEKLRPTQGPERRLWFAQVGGVGDDSSRSSNTKALRTQMSTAARTPAGMETDHRTQKRESQEEGENPAMSC